LNDTTERLFWQRILERKRLDTVCVLAILSL
jgi:hypothetical protein